MIIIDKMNYTVEDKLGYQYYNKDIDYFPSPYIKQTLIDDKVLIHNNLTGEILCLEKNEWLQNLDKKWLVNHWYYFSEYIDPFSIAYSLKQKVLNRESYKNNITDKFVVLTTTACNARCYYCYEAGCTQRTMSEKTALDVAKYILQNKKNKIGISWFGGEPLCNPKAIRTICNYYKNIGEQYSSTMISNGYLFNEFEIDEIKDLWHLNNVQITLDGTKNIYQFSKNYKNEDPNAYERVLDNIKMLLDNNIGVSIRLNVSLQNKDDLKLLIDELYFRFKDYKHFSVYASALFQNEGNPPIIFNDKELNMIADYTCELLKYIDNKGLDLGMTLHSCCPTCHCMADSGKVIVINPDGELSPCEHYTEGNEICGSIYSDEIDKEKLKTWQEELFLKECFECKQYPKCYRIKKCPSDNFCNKAFEKILDYKDVLLMKRQYRRYLDKKEK